MTDFARGEPAPWFTAPTESQPAFDFASLGGQYVLIGFLPLDDATRVGALKMLAAHQGLFDDKTLTALAVLRDEATIAQVRDQRGLRWILDRDGAVSRLYGALDEAGAQTCHWVLLDPTLRLLAKAPVGAEAGLFAALSTLPPPQDHARTPLSAPALITPRVFEPELCRRLIALYDQTGGRASGVMRDVDGKTVAVMDPYKKRRDVLVEAPDLRAELRDALRRRLVPEIAKAFCFEATRIERYLVACYDAEEGGFFRPHRDNTTRGTAHRRFAVSINLNSEDFEGGDLRFPEFGPQTYRAPTGGAVVFACALLHEARPVTKGRRYAFLPFLYDEAAAQVREANRAHLGEQREGAAGLTAEAEDRLAPAT
ncbi:2OG-Fe(II) oxygenase [Phenylobacterium aquaticum]|uniref:2OG-Fe(II) oxygenase n=1 Tax=Phenylobacterium aquaticum TaxID=1763816 RepID=UPI001F5CB443|nr:2OG-Fe(II) oxygenase [Phenylobacterium aquaticum]MCI3132904.1 2OG-Fe(II) oxygenase [Phenylobacterium aquaticum]